MKKLLVVLLGLGLVGCATVGKPLDVDKISQIKEGVTTKQEVISLFGTSNYDTRNGDGTEILVYTYANYKTKPSTFIPIVGLMAGGGDMKSQTVSIVFNKNGIVDKISSSNSVTDVNSGLLNTSANTNTVTTNK